MSYANGTQFYNLPQTVGTDKRDWFDTNSAFAAIDAALHSAVTGQASDAEAIATINGKLATDEADIAALQTKGNTHDSQIAALQTTVNSQTTQIQDVRQDAEDMITANNEGAAATSTRAYAVGDYFIYNDVLYKATAAIAIGDTIVPNTNCEATNVDTELSQLNSDLTYNTVIATVSTDGVKTEQELLNVLYSLAVASNKPLIKSRFARHDNSSHVTRYSKLEFISPTRLIYTSEIHANAEKQNYSYQFLLQASGSLASVCHITYTTGSEQAVTGTWVDETSNVPPAGSDWSIVV